MQKLTDKQMLNVNGGGFGASAFFLLAAGVTFVIGIIDGIVNPTRCKE